MNSPGKYSGPMDCFLSIFKEGGPQAFYKGFIPNVARLGFFNVFLQLTVEKIRKH